jgi:hypothetical protein
VLFGLDIGIDPHSDALSDCGAVNLLRGHLWGAGVDW